MDIRFIQREGGPVITRRNLDLSGLNCPQHVMRCKAALVTTQGGELLHVVMTDPRCHNEIPLLVRALGDEIERMETRSGVTEYWIRRQHQAATGRGVSQWDDLAPGQRFAELVSGLWGRFLPVQPVPVS